MASGFTSAVRVTAVSAMNKKHNSILWEIQNAREAAELASLRKKPVATISFDVGNVGIKFQCTLEHDSNSTSNILLNIEFLNMNRNGSKGSKEDGGSVFCIAASALQSKQQSWNSIFNKTFLSDSEWKEQIKIQKLHDYETSEGLLTLRFDVTEYQDEENEFCRTIIKRDKELDVLRTRSINNLTRDNLIMDFTSLLGDEATSDIKISVSSPSGEGDEIKVFFGHKELLSARNEVFRRMFENKEMKEVKESHVEISDISIKAMERFLRYLYTGIVMNESGDTEEEESFFQLLPEISYIADKYNDGHLKQVCETNLSRSATPENIRELLLCARLHGLTAAEAELRKIIARDPNKYLDALLND